jgi:Skp family chaperone for outer membrane proteins
MRKMLFAAGLIAALGGGWYGLKAALAAGTDGARAAASLPAKVAVIDLSQVFKNYRKYETLQGDIQEEVQAAQAKEQRILQTAQNLQNEMKSGVFERDSAEFEARENKLIQLQSQLQTQRAVAQKDIGQKHARILHTTYLEVMDVVSQLAERQGYTLVLQFNRIDAGPADDPQKVVMQLQQSVVRHSSQDDITDAVLGYLNRRYEQVSAPAAGRTSGGTATSPARTAQQPSKTAPARN